MQYTARDSEGTATRRTHKSRMSQNQLRRPTDSAWKPCLAGALIVACLFNTSPRQFVWGAGGGGGGGGGGVGGRTLSPPSMPVGQPCPAPVGPGTSKGPLPPGQGASPSATASDSSDCQCSGG